MLGRLIGGLDRADKTLLDRFYRNCRTFYLSKRRVCHPRAPKRIRDRYAIACENDPRIPLTREMMKLVHAHDVASISQLSAQERSKYLHLAKAALLDDEGFEVFLGELTNERASAAASFRAVWQNSVFDVDAILAIHKKLDGLRATSESNTRIAMPTRSLLKFIQGSTRETWHEFICNVEFPVRATGDVLETCVWIVTQKECDRATAVAFLALALMEGIHEEPYGHIDTAIAQNAMRMVADNLASGFYKISDFALLGLAKDYVYRNGQRLGEGSDIRIDWMVVGEEGHQVLDEPIKFDRNRPYKDNMAVRRKREFENFR